METMVRLTQKTFGGAVTLCLLAALALFSSACSGKTEGPYGPSEVLHRLAELRREVPVYVIQENSKFRDLKLAFYYFDMVDTFGLTTYFVEGADGVSIAKMRTDILTPALDGAMSDSQAVPLTWADNSLARTCEPKSSIFPSDAVPSRGYKTCLTWRAGGHSFLFFSSLGLDETLELINAMEKTR